MNLSLWVTNVTTESYNISTEMFKLVNNEEKELGRIINVVCRPILIVLGKLVYINYYQME